MKLDRELLHLAASEAVLIGLFAVFTYVGCRDPREHAELLVIFALAALAAFFYAFRLKRRHRRIGRYYQHGELDARADLKADINNLARGSIVTVCGTGATAVIHIAAEVYAAIKRGVTFEIFLLHPNDELVNRIAEVEPDFENRVFTPMVKELREQARLRERLGADWCDKTLKVLAGGSEVCGWHAAGHEACSSHTRVICTSADIWKRIADRVEKNDPGHKLSHGEVTVKAYRRLPLLKAWRLSPNSGHEGDNIYYVADYIYHAGVGVDNPMRRVDMDDVRSLGDDADTALVVNIDRVDTYLKQIENGCVIL